MTRYLEIKAPDERYYEWKHPSPSDSGTVPFSTHMSTIVRGVAAEIPPVPLEPFSWFSNSELPLEFAPGTDEDKASAVLLERVRREFNRRNFGDITVSIAEESHLLDSLPAAKSPRRKLFGLF